MRGLLRISTGLSFFTEIGKIEYIDPYHIIHVPCLNAEYCEAILYGYKYGLVTSYSITKPPTTNWIDQSQQQATELLLFK